MLYFSFYLVAVICFSCCKYYVYYCCCCSCCCNYASSIKLQFSVETEKKTLNNIFSVFYFNSLQHEISFFMLFYCMIFLVFLLTQKNGKKKQTFSCVIFNFNMLTISSCNKKYMKIFIRKWSSKKIVSILK